MIRLLLLSGLFMGWALGTNDSANAFGSAVASGAVRYRIATVVIAVMVLLGAAFMGERNLDTVAELACTNRVSATEEEIRAAAETGTQEVLLLHSAWKAAIVYLCAGATVFLMSVLQFPVSANQSIAGAVIGWGLCRADYSDPAVLTLNLSQIGRFLAAWLISPLAAGITAWLMLRCAGRLLKDAAEHHEEILQFAYLITGAVASFSIGANSSGVVTALYYGESFTESGIAVNLLTNREFAAILGGAAIALGALTYSRRVMQTVGSNITPLSQPEGLLVVLAMALSVLGMGKWLAIPVSTSEAVVGAVIGAGLTRGRRNVRFRVLGRIAAAWVCSPVIAGALSCIFANLTRNVLP